MSGYLFEDIVAAQQPSRGLGSREPWFAIVASDPALLTDRIMVTIPAFAVPGQKSRSLIGPCRWQSRDATSLPVRGDEALVIFDDQQQPWVTAWWPQ